MVLPSAISDNSLKLNKKLNLIVTEQVKANGMLICIILTLHESVYLDLPEKYDVVASNHLFDSET